MSNRRLGGMGGLNRGNNRSFSQPSFQSGLNPWQGGGPMQNNQGGAPLSQLASNPQQLVLALTSLLQSPQQQQMNPPSLLSLNTSPAFSHQNRDFNNDRFGNRGRDMRRHEPYNKNRAGGWRPLDNRNKQNNQRNQGGNRRRSPQRDNRTKDDKNKKENKDKTEKSPEKKKKSSETVDLSMDEEKEDGKDTKRDWKDEKNQAEEAQTDSGDEEKDAKSKEGRYSGVPIKFLNCFVCNKEMWDGESMWKHVRGRAHSQMLKSLEESIHITVNILRENMRLSEEKKLIERNRVHRLKKFNNFNDDIESHCNMCDLKFMGKIVAHRRTMGHQRLKRYLHPDCKICDKEFPSRLDWIDHRLTPEHLKNLSEDIDTKTGGAKGMDIFKLEEENLEPLLDEALQMEVENPILELDDNLENLQNLMPAYKKDRAVATKALKPFTGFMCELCNRSFENEDIAQAHLKSLKHYYAFVGVIKEKNKQDLVNKEKKEAEEAKAKENEAKKEEEDENMEEQDEAAQGEENEEEEENAAEDAVENGEKVDPSDSNSQLPEDVEMAETEEKTEEELLKEEEEEDEAVEETPAKKEEPAPVKATPAAPANRPLRGNVKNGAGPKSKKATPAKEPEKPANAANYRIPKTAAGKATPKKK